MQKTIISTCTLLIIFLTFPVGAIAQSGLSLTVTPPLLKVSVAPGESWQSRLKIVNTNDYELTVYATPVNFRSTGEGGASKFFPAVEEEEEARTHSLAKWIQVTDGPIVIPPHQSESINFTIAVPENAEPGGHYGAILVGPQPIDGRGDGPSVRVSALVSSLMFVRVPGDIVEKGSIREFTTPNSLYERPEVDFGLRFENTGNVHLLPQGDITIYNMWGKKRGYVPINQRTDFGNVLPDSVRKFNFQWKGEQNIFDIGRYRAVATVSYGESARQNSSASVYFWIVPLKPTIVVLGSFITFITLLFVGIRFYVRRVVEIHEKKYGLVPTSPTQDSDTFSRAGVGPKPSPVQSLAAPITEGVIDLRKFVDEEIGRRSTAVGEVDAEEETTIDLSSKKIEAKKKELPLIFKLLRRYALLFSFITLIIGGVIGSVFFFAEVLTKERSYEVVVSRGGVERTISSEEIIREDLLASGATNSNVENGVSGFDVDDEMGATTTAGETSSTDLASTEDALTREPAVIILNGSGKPGLAARLSIDLEAEGYTVSRIGNAGSFNYEKTVIQYGAGDEEMAVGLRDKIGVGELEVLKISDADLRIIIGSDYDEVIEGA